MFHIVLIPSEKYIKYSTVLINSIVKNTDTSKSFKDFCKAKAVKASQGSILCDDYKNIDFNTLSDEEKKEGFIFHILSDFVSDENRTKLDKLAQELSKHYPCKIEIHIMDVDEFKNLPLPHWIDNHATYYRLKSVSVIPENATRVLNLDTDMLVLCDLRELFALDFKDKLIAACEDAPYFTRKHLIIKSLNPLKSDFTYTQKDDFVYFNAGLMLINTQKWRALDIETKLFEFARNYAVQICEQDALNCVIQNDGLKLPQTFNFFAGIWNLARFGFFTPFEDESEDCYFKFTKSEFEAMQKDIKIIHYCHWCVKPWQNCFWLDLAYKPTKYPYYDTWWDYALDTPIFKDELQILQNELKDNALFEFANALGDKLVARDKSVNERLNALNDENLRLKAEFLKLQNEYIKTLNETKNKLLILIDPKLESAAVRVRNQLSYRLGKAIIANSKSFIGYLKLPFALLKAFLIYKKKEKIYKARISYNPNLKLPPIETYPDFNEALKIKNHLSYKLGSAFLKGLKTWYKGGLIKFIFKAKRLEREFKKDRHCET